MNRLEIMARAACCGRNHCVGENPQGCNAPMHEDGARAMVEALMADELERRRKLYPDNDEAWLKSTSPLYSSLRSIGNYILDVPARLK